MRYSGVLEYLAVFLFLIFTVQGVSAATLNVGVGQTYTTIQSAIDAAVSGDTIEVGNGTYDETLNINTDNLTIQAAEGENPIIGLQNSVSGFWLIRIDSNNATLRGFELVGAGNASGGIRINGNNATIQDNRIENVLTGIQTTTDPRDSSRILNNIISNVTVGISLQNDNNIVSGNNINAISEGFGLASFNTQFSNNQITVGEDGYEIKVSGDTDNDIRYLGSIQDGINAANNGYTVYVNPVNTTTYEGDLVIDKEIKLIGPNTEVNPNTETREQEATITGQITISSDNVEINGFTVTNPSVGYGIVSTDYSNLHILNNIVQDVGITLVSGSAQAIYIKSSNLNVSEITIENNRIENIGSLNLVFSGSGSAKGIFFGDSSGTKDFEDVEISSNVISDIYASTIAFSEGGRGANGILINHGTGLTGKTIAPRVLNNTIYNLEGYWAHGIGLEGNTPNALIEGNVINNLTEHKFAVEGIYDSRAIMVEDNDGAESVIIIKNKFSNVISGVVNVMEGKTVNASYNYWGSVTPNFTALVSGNVTTEPYLNNPPETTPDAPEISINESNSHTNNNLVNLILTVGGNLPDLFALSLNNINWTEWMVWGHSNQVNVTVDLTNFSIGGNLNDGEKTVYVNATSYSGNKNSTTNNDSITYDITAPFLTNVSINGAFFNGTDYIFSPENQDGNFDEIEIIMNASELVDWKTVYFYNSSGEPTHRIQSLNDFVSGNLISWDGTYNFGYGNGNVPSGSYIINLSSSDGSALADLAGNINGTIFLGEVFVDNDAPVFSNQKRSLTNPQADEDVQLNITISDNTQLEEVILNFNGTNYTVSSNNLGEFYFVIDSENYNVGETVIYKWHARDVVGNINTSEENSFLVVSRPAINSASPDSASLSMEESENQLFNLNVSDSDLNDTLNYLWEVDGEFASNQSGYNFTTDYNSAGNYIINATITDNYGLSISRQWNLTVVNNQNPVIVSSSPTQNNVAVKTNQSQSFSVIATDLEDDDLNYSWFVNSEIQSETNNSFAYNSSTPGDFNILVNVTDVAGNFATRNWTFIVTERPIVRTFTSSETTNLSTVQNISAVQNFTLAKQENGNVNKIDFGNEILDLSEVIDIDNAVRIENGIVAVDTNKYPQLNKPATLTISGLSYDTVPKIFYNDSFTITSNEIVEECEFCEIIDYTPFPTTNGFVTFTVEHFTSFKVGGSEEIYDINDYPDLNKCVNGSVGDLELDVNGPDEGEDFELEDIIEVDADVSNSGSEKNVVVETSLYSIDDDDELETEDDTEKIGQGDSESFELELEIPDDFKHSDDYLIFVKAYERNNEENQCIQGLIGVNLDREDDDVRITDVSLLSQSVYPGSVLDLNIKVQNYGSDDQKEVYIEAYNSVLGISERSETFEIEEAGDDDFVTMILSVKIPEETEKGDYNLNVRVVYGSDRDEETVNFNVLENVIVPSSTIEINQGIVSTLGITGSVVSEGLSSEVKTIMTLVELIIFTLVLILVIYAVKFGGRKKKMRKEDYIPKDDFDGVSFY